MTDFLLWVGIGYALCFGVWCYYLAVMALKHGRDELRARDDDPHWFVEINAFAAIALGAPFYVLLNLTVGTILFLQLPRELQFTKRCQRNIRRGSGWRKALARWLCVNVLDPFDGGKHC